MMCAENYRECVRVPTSIWKRKESEALDLVFERHIKELWLLVGTRSHRNIANKRFYFEI